MPRPKPNHIGKRFGRLIVLSEGPGQPHSSGYTRANWVCQCDCGGSITTLTANLTSGRTRSCGCLNDEKRKVSRLTHVIPKKSLIPIMAVVVSLFAPDGQAHSLLF